MQTHVRRLLPASIPAQLAGDGANGREGQHRLVQQHSQDEACVVACRPALAIGAAEVAEPGTGALTTSAVAMATGMVSQTTAIRYGIARV